jgi:hypothetical protein
MWSTRLAIDARVNILVSCAQIIFWDASIKKQVDIDTDIQDEVQAAALASEKYQWKPVFQIDLTIKSLHRQVGILKFILCGGSKFFCCNEVSDADRHSLFYKSFVRCSFFCR